MPDDRERLKRQLTDLIVRMGYPRHFGELIGSTLGTPKALERMIHYLLGVQPSSAEEIADEMLAIREELDSWKQKKSAEYFNMKNNELLNRGLGIEDEEEDEYDGEEF